MTRPRVLIVEDDPGLRLALEHGLDAEGFDVAVAPDADAACDRAAEVRPHLVLLDWGLPNGTGGTAACRRLLRAPPTGQVAMHTGRRDREAGRQAADASLAAILNASTPLFSAVVAAAVGDEPFTARRAAGLALGIGGVGLVVGLAHVRADLAFFGAAACSLAAALCYALGTTYVRHAMAGEPPATLALFQQLAAGALLLPVVAAVPPPHAPDAGDLGALAGLAVLSTSLAYLLYFRLVAEVGPTSTLTVTFLVPVFGVLWATLFLGEP